MMTRMSTHEDDNSIDVPVGKPRYYQPEVNKNHGFGR